MASLQSNNHSSVGRSSLPALNVPPSLVSVEVKIIDVCSIANVSSKSLFTPQVPGFELIKPAPSFVFLLEHPSGQKVLFDLGIRKDWENLDQAVVQRLRHHGYSVIVDKEIEEALSEGGLEVKDISAVIWSHAHWDHMGDMSRFDGTTDLVVGPGFKHHFLSGGDGNSSLGGVLPTDVERRNVREIAFEKQDPHVVQIGQFSAYDYFHDGSLYLMDTPGHCVGHLCALARTTTNPDSFVFLGGDAAHHCGEIRPSNYVPLPESILLDATSTVKSSISVQPRHWYERLQTSRGRDPAGPVFQPAFGYNMGQVLDTIGGVQQYDGDSNVLIILAHDASFRDAIVPKFPASLNDWKDRGLEKKLKWKWVGDIFNCAEEHK